MFCALSPCFYLYGGECMILKQELIELNDGKGGLKLVTEYDCSAAISLAKQVNEFGDNRMGDKNDGCRVMGFIPPEMWMYDVYLIAARSALKRGDRGKYTTYLKKFFKENSVFRTPHKRIYWGGSQAVLL